MMLEKSGERVFPDQFENIDEYLVFLRHLFAYEYAMNHLSSKDSVLELGCGEGYGTNLLSRKCYSIVGLDVHMESLNHAVSKYESENCKFQLYNGVRIPFADESFEKVVLFQVIEHVEDDLGFFKEIARVLKPGGTLFLTTPSRSYRLKPGQKPWNPYHIREYYLRDLLDVMKKTFSSATVNGIRATKEVQKKEFSRVQQNHKISSVLIRKIPPVIKETIKKQIARSEKKKAKTFLADEILRKYSTGDFYVIEDGIDDHAIDLLGIAKK